MSATAEFVVTLDPDEAGRRFVAACKDRAASRLRGETPRYLGDAPHLTLYVATLPAETGERLDLGAAAGSPLPPTPVTGWHTFFDDPVTGGHTLTLGLASPEDAPLRGMQDRVVGIVSPLRAGGLPARYLHLREDPGPLGVSLRRVGYPFAGPIWFPHVSIASFSREAYRLVWPDLEAMPWPSRLHFTSLSLHRLDKDVLTPLRHWPLSHA